MAEQNRRTVEELLTGRMSPISLHEFQMWAAYFRVKAYYQEEHNRQQK